MSAAIVSEADNQLTLQITINLDPKSMLGSEDSIRESLNQAGCLATSKALEQFDTDGTPIVIGKTKLTSRGKIHNTYQSIWGEVGLERHVYQSSKGGKQYVPLEKDARIFLTATPGFAKLVSFKYAEMGSSRALADLEVNHGRPVARSYLKAIGDSVGAIAVAKEESWEYAPPELERRVKSMAVGIDGTCMLMTEHGWREAMVATISLYDKEGERLHIIQMGATPEYGNELFYERFDKELEAIKARYPRAVVMGIADGAKANWTYLKKRTDRQTLDFYHASGYLGKAADAMFTGKGKKHLKTEWLDEACHKLKHSSGAASRLLREMEKCIEEKRCSKTKKEALEASVTYFTNNKHMMKYAKSLQENLPIGSGVTEAACKTLVKQRLCNSGMRWKEEGAQKVLTLRALSHTDCRWDQFWKKVDRDGFSIAA